MIALVFLLVTSWTTDVVTTVTDLNCPPIALDSLRNPYIIVSKDRILIPLMVYYLFLYCKVNGNWVVDTFELNSYDPENTDIAIDKYNRVWCIYNAYNEVDTTWHLIVACKDSMGWSKDTVELNDLGSDFHWLSISTDTLGDPHIAYNHSGSGFYAYMSDSAWQKDVVDSMSLAYCCAIDVDSQNQPQVSYFHPAENLWFAKKIANSWYREEVDYMNNAPSWWTTSIKVNNNGLPAVAYRDPNTYQMKYAYHDGGLWYIDTVESLGGIGTQKALDIDSLNKPYLLYNAFVAYKDSIVWHKEPLPALTPPLTMSWPGALRIGRDGTLHLTRLATNDDYTYREIHYIYGTIIGIEEEDTKFKVFIGNLGLQIYPNPVHRNCNIRYTLPQNTRVNILMYDVTGRLVKETINESQSIGIYNKTFDMTNLPQGIYFIRLNTENHSDTKKIIFIK
jgi:hypothetical protein